MSPLHQGRRVCAVLALVAVGCANNPEQPSGGIDGGRPGPGDPDAGPIGNPDVDAGDPVQGCTGGNGAAAQPFGNHQRGYASGSIVPSQRSQSELDDAVRSFYDYWRSTYVRAGCAGGHYHVATGQPGSITVSEAHGYGMIIAAYMAGHDGNAREIFDGMYRYFVAHPSEGDGNLMAWSQDFDCDNNEGSYSASDGDLDIAYALLLADKQWGSDGDIDYRAAAGRVIDAIAWAEVDASGSWVLLGDWTSPGSHHYNATRSSDIMPGHLASFRAATGDGMWSTLLDRSYTMVASLQSQHAPTTGLLPDFILSPASGPHPAEPNFLERDVDGAYSYNACRVPWRLGVHYLTSGDSRARTALERMNGWIRARTGGDPYAVASGYWLDGDVLPGAGYFGPAFAAPFGVAAMASSANQAWLDALWNAIEWSDPAGYYHDTLKLLGMIAMSGNWWAPEAAPCAD